VEVKKNSVVMAIFLYDGDGRQVKATVNGVTTLYIGGHYEIKGNEVSKYYFAGAARSAMRRYVIPQPMTVEYLLSDHLGSTSLVTDSAGALVSEARYKPWGEVRYTKDNAPLPTLYTYTGQRSYVSDAATGLGSSGFGLMFYNARFFDPHIGHFTSPDTLITDDFNTLDYDRYQYARSNPLKYNDPSGHCVSDPVSFYICVLAAYAAVATVAYIVQTVDQIIQDSTDYPIVTQTHPVYGPPAPTSTPNPTLAAILTSTPSAPTPTPIDPNAPVYRAATAIPTGIPTATQKPYIDPIKVAQNTSNELYNLCSMGMGPSCSSIFPKMIYYEAITGTAKDIQLMYDSYSAYKNKPKQKQVIPK
jgi:RHS repeat-associated protein